jgi:hypothetical protein
MRASITVFFLSFFSFVLLAQDNDICRIDLPSTRVAAFAYGERVEFSFEYSITAPGGAFIFARPYTNGALTPGYGASGSPLYTGDGVSNAFFTINGGEVVVDEIRFLITNPSQSETLREFYIPVEYHFSPDGVNNFRFSEDPEIASFLLGEQVEITFDYNISNRDGARIFVRPFTDGNLTPGYGASGSILFTGTGSRTVNFRINSGKNVHVDELRVMILNADQSDTLKTFYVPVNWYWSTVKISNFSIVQDNFAANGENRTIAYDYETTEAAGVRIYPRPVTNGSLSPGYAACGSGLYTGSGGGSCNFTINSGNQRVDHIRFQVTNPDQSQDLLVLFQPTDLFFGNLLIENLVTCPPSPARLLHGERVNGFFDYTNNQGENGRFFFRPATEGSLSPGYGASGSPSYPPNSGSGNAFFTINGGNVIVDQIHFVASNSSQSVDWGIFRYDVQYQYGDGMITSVQAATVSDYLSWQLAPNPTRDITTLTIRSEEQTEVNIHLLDLQGRSMQQWNSLALPAGAEVRLPLSLAQLQLPGGMYLVQIQGATFQTTKKLILSR